LGRLFGDRFVKAQIVNECRCKLRADVEYGFEGYRMLPLHVCPVIRKSVYNRLDQHPAEIELRQSG
jgi:hypothetical protein